MERVTVALPEIPYDVVVGAGVLTHAPELLAGRRKVAVISQAGVADFHAPALLTALHTAGVDTDPSDGLSDRREMSSTLVTTQGGATSAGALGVSEGSRGNPKTGEPNPVVVPAVPAPETLQYVTVVDNGNHGGFAGSRPVGQAESFRCAYDKGRQGSTAPTT